MSETKKNEGVSPAAVIEMLAKAAPEECKKNIVVIGSLAAGYRYFGDNSDLLVQTKDIDCLLQPYLEAVAAGENIAETLLNNDWQYAPSEDFPAPGNDATPTKDLPAVRLFPPGGSTWFVELLTVGKTETDLGRGFIPLETSHGRFALCAFGGIRLTQWNPISTSSGIAIARPEMMVLSNLLHHKEIGDERMSKAIGGTSIKRSNKDLGRVLALAYLAERDKEDALLEWKDSWLCALDEYFPATWRVLAADAGAGLRALLASDNDLDEAHHTCQHGLVGALSPTLETLRGAGKRLLVDAIEPLEAEATSKKVT